MDRKETVSYCLNSLKKSGADKASCSLSISEKKELNVENGEILAPIENMRFDDSIYNFFGDNLESVSDKSHYHPTVQTYEGRELGGVTCPGILLKSFER